MLPPAKGINNTESIPLAVFGQNAKLGKTAITALFTE